VPGLNATLAKELVTTRNAIAHLSRSISNALEGVDLLYAVERLRLVIQVDLLLDLGLSSETVGSFVLTSYGRQVPIVDYREAQPPPSCGSRWTPWRSREALVSRAPRPRDAP
jgi:hypothetical protein